MTLDPDGTCKHEGSMAILVSQGSDTRDDVKEILKTLQGNGGDGLVTRVALNKQSIRRVWWWVGPISVSLLGIAVWVIRAAVTKG